jgi:hypothetical protein
MGIGIPIGDWDSMSMRLPPKKGAKPWVLHERKYLITMLNYGVAEYGDGLLYGRYGTTSV